MVRQRRLGVALMRNSEMHGRLDRAADDMARIVAAWPEVTRRVDEWSAGASIANYGGATRSARGPQDASPVERQAGARDEIARRRQRAERDLLQLGDVVAELRRLTAAVDRL